MYGGISLLSFPLSLSEYCFFMFHFLHNQAFFIIFALKNKKYFDKYAGF